MVSVRVLCISPITQYLQFSVPKGLCDVRHVLLLLCVPFIHLLNGGNNNTYLLELLFRIT